MFTAILYWQTQLATFFALFWAEGAHGVPLHWKIINLVVFLSAIFLLVRKPFSQAMADRKSSIQSELKRAKAEKEAAENKLREIEAQAEYARLSKQTEEEAERLQSMASREIEGATKLAQIELKRFAAQKAVELAENIIRKELKPTDAARLVNDFAKELEGAR